MYHIANVNADFKLDASIRRDVGEHDGGEFALLLSAHFSVTAFKGRVSNVGSRIQNPILVLWSSTSEGIKTSPLRRTARNTRSFCTMQNRANYLEKSMTLRLS